MLFKQKCSKYLKEIMGFTTCVISILIIAFIFAVIILPTDFTDSRAVEDMVLGLVLFSPMIITLLICPFAQLEWFLIFEDRIEARGIFGIKNTVYFSKVLYIEELGISYIKNSPKRPFYMFNDGRKNNNSFLGVNNWYNKKKFNLRIPITDELENFVKTHLSSKLKATKL